MDRQQSNRVRNLREYNDSTIFLKNNRGAYCEKKKIFYMNKRSQEVCHACNNDNSYKKKEIPHYIWKKERKTTYITWVSAFNIWWHDIQSFSKKKIINK